MRGRRRRKLGSDGTVHTLPVKTSGFLRESVRFHQWNSRYMYKSYEEYLSSVHWSNLRDAKLKQHGSFCCRCKRGDHLQIHHVIYRSRWEDSKLEDLEVLCRRCHEKHHGIKRKKKKKEKPPVKKKSPPCPKDIRKKLQHKKSVALFAKPGNSHFLIIPWNS